MPGFDKSGPMGMGPRTGRGFGPCAGVRGYKQGYGYGYGFARGRGRGMNLSGYGQFSRGRGRGNGMGMARTFGRGMGFDGAYGAGMGYGRGMGMGMYARGYRGQDGYYADEYEVDDKGIIEDQIKFLEEELELAKKMLEDFDQEE